MKLNMFIEIEMKTKRKKKRKKMMKKKIKKGKEIKNLMKKEKLVTKL